MPGVRRRHRKSSLRKRHRSAAVRVGMGLTCRGAHTELAEKAQKIIHVDATGAVQVGAGVRDFGARLAVCTTAPFQSCQGSGAPDPETGQSRAAALTAAEQSEKVVDIHVPGRVHVAFACGAIGAGRRACAVLDAGRCPDPASGGASGAAVGADVGGADAGVGVACDGACHVIARARAAAAAAAAGAGAAATVPAAACATVTMSLRW